jgi:hypothetical protein
MMAEDDLRLSSNIKRLLLYAHGHLAVDDEQRLGLAHDSVVETFAIVLKQFPEYGKNPPFELMVDVLRRLIMRDGRWME